MKDGKRVRGQRVYKCAHGVERKSRSKDEKRPFQKIKFTGCPAKVYINEQDNGSWKITTCDQSHEGHDISESNYLNQNKEIDETDKAMVSEMLNVQANNKNIADVLSKKTGKIFNFCYDFEIDF